MLPRFSEPGLTKPPRLVFLAVGIVALFAAGLGMRANHLWMSPEARGYVVLAGEIAERFDFSHDLFLLRTPGYPLLLAGVFRVFQENSPIAIQAVQHLMVAATAILTAWVAWQLTRAPSVTLLSGMLTICNLQLWAFANMVMSEVPFTLASMAAVYGILLYHDSGRLAHLAAASTMIGISYAFRPIGLSLLVVAVFAAVRRKARAIDKEGTKTRTEDGSKRRALAPRVLCGLLPSLMIAGAWMTHLGARVNGVRAGIGPTLFGRLATLDRLDASESEAWAEMQAVVTEAKSKGWIAPDADARKEGNVVDAYTLLNRASYSEVCGKMQQVGLDLLRANVGVVLHRSISYAAWALLVPDSSYRFVPGGAPGVQVGPREWVRDPHAEVFDCATYDPMMRPLIGPYARYLPLRKEPKHATPVWMGLVRWFHRTAEPKPGSISPYAILVASCLAGSFFCLLFPNRYAWFLVGLAVTLLCVGSAVLVGPVPRYAVPVQPLLGIVASASFVAAIRACRCMLQAVRHRSPIHAPA